MVWFGRWRLLRSDCCAQWQVPTEIHTIETRSAGQSVTVFFNFIASFSIAQAFLSIICRLQVRIAHAALSYTVRL